MNQHQPEFDIVIVGAGVIGSALALTLSKSLRCNIAVLERNSALKGQELKGETTSPERILALGAVAKGLLEELGVFEQLESKFAHPYQGMYVWDSQGRGEIEFQADDYSVDALGHMVSSGQLNFLIQQALTKQQNVKLMYQQEVSSLDFGEAKAEVGLQEGGGSISGRLLVAADGAQSKIRQLAKIFSHKKPYHQQAIVAEIKTEVGHADTAYQVFLETGPIGVLPLSDGRSSIVWSADNERAKALLALDEQQFSRELQSALDGKLGEISFVSPRRAFPLISQRSETYFRENLVLLGDAAHSIHPLAGLGANLGFKDITALQALLEDCEPRQFGDTALLQKYQFARKSDNEQTDALMTGLYELFKQQGSFLPRLRGLGMSQINRAKTIKEALARQAMGLN